MKIYSDDPLVHYKTSTIAPERTKMEIDGLLAEWQSKDIHWHGVGNPFDSSLPDVYVQFKVDEVVNEVPISVAVKVQCPIIWDKEKPKTRPPKPESINWRISMREMWWFLKTHLEMAYVMQSEKVRAFLAYIPVSETQNLGDKVIPRLAKVGGLEALEDRGEYSAEKLRKVITIPKEEGKP